MKLTRNNMLQRFLYLIIVLFFILSLLTYFMERHVHVFSSYSYVNVMGSFPRRVHKLQRRFVPWDKILARQKMVPKFDFFPKEEKDDLHVHIISLRRKAERSEKLLNVLKTHNISFLLFDAIDGLEYFDSEDVNMYANKKRKNAMLLRRIKTKDHFVRLDEQYKMKTISKRDKFALHERLKFGCYMSHVKLWQKLISINNWKFITVLEDDVQIPNPASFVANLSNAMKMLPYNWDMLWLNSCNGVAGEFLARGVRQYRGGSCAMGYVVSRKAAHRYAFESARNTHIPIDFIMNNDIYIGKMYAYIADPPLITLGDTSASSTLGYR